MAMAIVALTFSACTDDESFLAKVNYPQEATGDKMVVDAWANEFPLEIKTEGAWKVESDSYFFTVEPEEGSGNATVTVSVQNNTRSKRKTGHLTIVFPGHEGENKALTIEQKWKGEYTRTRTSSAYRTKSMLWALATTRQRDSMPITTA